MQSIARKAALTVACAAVGLLGLDGATASATNYAYCGTLIPASQWCSSGVARANSYNRASYPGPASDQVYVCERLVIVNSGTPRESPSCYYTYREKYYSTPYPYLTYAQVEWTAGPGSNHTIDGLSAT
jgi:hypothetical protein